MEEDENSGVAKIKSQARGTGANDGHSHLKGKRLRLIKKLEQSALPDKKSDYGANYYVTHVQEEKKKKTKREVRPRPKRKKELNVFEENIAKKMRENMIGNWIKSDKKESKKSKEKEILLNIVKGSQKSNRDPKKLAQKFSKSHFKVEEALQKNGVGKPEIIEISSSEKIVQIKYKNRKNDNFSSSKIQNLRESISKQEENQKPILKDLKNAVNEDNLIKISQNGENIVNKLSICGQENLIVNNERQENSVKSKNSGNQKKNKEKNILESQNSERDKSIKILKPSEKFKEKVRNFAKSGSSQKFKMDMTGGKGGNKLDSSKNEILLPNLFERLSEKKKKFLVETKRDLEKPPDLKNNRFLKILENNQKKE